MEPEGSLPHSQEPATGPRLCDLFRNMVIFYGEEFLAPRPTPKLEDHPLSAVRDCLFNVFAATLHIRRPFLHPQPEDATCRGNRDPFIMVTSYNQAKLFKLPTKGKTDPAHVYNATRRCKGTLRVQLYYFDFGTW
jgi:hypothetical protein